MLRPLLVSGGLLELSLTGAGMFPSDFWAHLHTPCRQVLEKSDLRKQPKYDEHKSEPWWRIQLFLSKPSVCLSPGISYQYWSFQVIYSDRLHNDTIQQMLTFPASNEFRYFALYIDAKSRSPQVVWPWPVVTSALINETGPSWNYLSIFQGSGDGGWRKHIIPAEAEFQVLASLGEAIQTHMFVLEFPDVKIHPYIFGLSWAGGVGGTSKIFANDWVLELLSSPKWIVLLHCVKDPRPAPAEAVLQWWPL